MPSLGLVPIPRRRRCSAKLEEKNFRKVASGRPDDDMGTQTSVGHAVHHQRTAHWRGINTTISGSFCCRTAASIERTIGVSCEMRRNLAQQKLIKTRPNPGRNDHFPLEMLLVQQQPLV